MFRRLSEPLPLSEASLLALRPALNAPVLNVGFLPVGPARAAIVVFAEEWGGIGVSIGIRSNEGGQVAVFRNQESIEPEVSISAALEPALAEAERMGFLFDEDMVENAETGQSQAMALWARLMGEIEMPAAPASAPADPAANDPLPVRPQTVSAMPPEKPAEEVSEAIPEFVLEDVAVVELPEIPLELEAEAPQPPAKPVAEGTPSEAPASSASQETQPFVLSEPVQAAPAPPPRREPARPVAPVSPQLSRFRNGDGKSSAQKAESAAASGSGEGASTLGRIPLVRVRRGRDGGKRISYLAKLLSSF